jgi:tRNA (cytosine38-C5)-methyltransferase
VFVFYLKCQPFTQGGKKLDHEDARCAALLHLIDLISSGAVLPSYLALENVPLFRESHCRNLLVAALEMQGFSFAEYVVSPDELCLIPNRRVRYYLVACSPSHAKTFPVSLNLGPMESLPSLREYLGDELASEQEARLLAVPQSWTAKKTGFRFHCVSLDRNDSTQCMTKAYFENKV